MAISIDGLTLYSGDDSTNAVEAQMDVTSVMGQDEEEALIVALEAAESMSISGLATGNLISSKAGYSSDPQDALAEWVQKFESLATPDQGTGWSVVDDERDRTITATVASLSWTFVYGAIFEARWTIDLRRGENVSQSASRSFTSQTPSNTVTLGGTDLGTLTEKRTELRLDLDAVPLALSSTSETVIVPQSGVVRQVTMTGRKAGTASELRTFDNTMRGNVGGTDTGLTFQTGFPGTSHTVHIENYDSTYRGGSPSILDYAMTVNEGLNINP